MLNSKYSNRLLKRAKRLLSQNPNNPHMKKMLIIEEYEQDMKLKIESYMENSQKVIELNEHEIERLLEVTKEFMENSKKVDENVDILQGIDSESIEEYIER